MSQGVNELTAKGVESSVNGLMSMLELTVTGVEEMVVFVVNLLTQTYLCLITLAIRGSLGTVIGAAKDVTDFLDEALGDIGESIEGAADDFEGGVNKIIEGLNSIPQLFGSDDEIPTFDISEFVDEIKNLELPKGIEEGLDKLNASIPTFDEVNSLTNSALRLPFEQVKELISESMVEFNFDRSTFPVPQREQLTFCSDDDGINDFFDSLEGMASTARKIFIAVFVVLATLVCIPMAYREIKRWHLMQRRAQLISNKAYDPQDVVYIASRPTSSTIGIKIANRFSSLRNQTLVRWAVAYATSTPALFVLTLGITGLFACLCQFVLLRSVEQQVPELTEQVGAFAEKVVAQLDGASQNWAVGANDAIRSTSDELNEKIFGWVDTSSTGLNDTLNTFVDEMMGTLNDTFGDTPLYEPITEVLNCLILLKIEGIQKGLTWVNENARIDFPELPADTFTLGALASLGGEDSEFGDKANSFLASPSSVAADDISAALARLTSKIESGIQQEALISTVILLLWLVVALIGIGRSTMLFFTREKTRGEGGGPAYAADSMAERHRGFDGGGGVSDVNAVYNTRNGSNNNNNNNNVVRDFSPENGNYDDDDTADLGVGGLPPYAAAIKAGNSNHNHNEINHAATTTNNKAHLGPSPSNASSSSSFSKRSNILPPIPSTSTFSPTFHAFASSSTPASSTPPLSNSYLNSTTYPPEKSLSAFHGGAATAGDAAANTAYSSQAQTHHDVPNEKIKFVRAPHHRVDTAVTKPNMLRASSYADCLSVTPGLSVDVNASASASASACTNGTENLNWSNNENSNAGGAGAFGRGRVHYGLPANPYPASANPFAAAAAASAAAATGHKPSDTGGGMPPMLIAGMDPFADADAYPHPGSSARV